MNWISYLEGFVSCALLFTLIMFYAVLHVRRKMSAALDFSHLLEGGLALPESDDQLSYKTPGGGS